MVLVIDAVNKDLHDDVYASMLDMRERSLRRYGILPEGLADGGSDYFDNLNPTDVVCLSKSGGAAGSLRLLQTSGPHMLSEVMSNVLSDDFSLRSPHIWECNCIEVDPDLGSALGFARREVLAKLFIGAINLAMDAAVTDLLTLYNDHTEMLMREIGAEPYEVLGRLNQGKDRYLVAGLIECTPAKLEKIRFLSGIYTDVIRSDLEARQYIDEIQEDVAAGSEQALDSMKAAAVGNLTDSEKLRFARFCMAQMDAARSEAERAEAFQLLRSIIDQED